ncbi:hypothetical protein [Streptomyces sp. NPDC006134]|uniref:hypothetical protein n=1 Tax=Streptomyces sp. NPDC006134 TaxID=3154467 RepID=UPI0034055CB0
MGHEWFPVTVTAPMPPGAFETYAQASARAAPAGAPASAIVSAARANSRPAKAG